MVCRCCRSDGWRVGSPDGREHRGPDGVTDAADRDAERRGRRDEDLDTTTTTSAPSSQVARLRYDYGTTAATVVTIDIILNIL